MARTPPSEATEKPRETLRGQRLKAALKANMARRKLQSRLRAAAEGSDADADDVAPDDAGATPNMNG